MVTAIAHICKNKNGDAIDASNYRFVSQATIHSPLFEHYILSCISPFVAIADKWFDFKPQRGTDVCVFLLKQIMSYCVPKTHPCSQHFYMHLRRKWIGAPAFQTLSL